MGLQRGRDGTEAALVVGAQLAHQFRHAFELFTNLGLHLVHLAVDLIFLGQQLLLSHGHLMANHVTVEHAGLLDRGLD
jgi:hypothetical protein